MADYDIGKAFDKIEHEIMMSMIRNMKRHRLEEINESRQWSMWQTEQLKALEKFKRENYKKYNKKFKDINSSIDSLLREARAQGGMEQEMKILRAMKKGFIPKKRRKSTETLGEFFKLNDRKLEVLIKATTEDMEKAETAVLRMSEDQYRKIIFDAQVYANTGAGTYEKAVDMATKDFLSRGINCIQYANGARHTIAAYADMAIRTAAKRAYLQGEGEMRKEWGITTVVMNKRGNACPLCLPFVGKVLIDDVWSGGSAKDGPYLLMSIAIAKGLYHPNCCDVHTTYFEGISTPPDSTFTKKEIEQLKQDYQEEQKQKYAKRQAEKFGRLAEFSLDEENQKKYKAKERFWTRKRNKSEEIAKRQYEYFGKMINQVESEISQLNYEVGVIFDEDGKAIASVCQKGEEHAVDFKKLRRQMKGKVVTHNHIFNTPPSPEDLYVLKNTKAKEFRACGKTGSYVLKYSKSLSKLPKFEVFNQEYEEITDMLLPKYLRKVRQGQISDVQGERLMQEEAWKILSKRYNIDYSFEGEKYDSR